MKNWKSEASEDFSDQAKLIRALLGIVIILVFGHLAGFIFGDRYWHVERIFNLNIESNIPTWYSSFVLMLGALSAFRCARRSLMRGEEFGWWVIGAVLLFLSCDEVSMFHDYFGRAVGKKILLAWPEASLLFHETPWVIGFLPFILITAAAMFFAIVKCVSTSDLVVRYLLVGLALYGVGSVGCELALNFLNRDSLEWLWQIEIIVEESLEMIGTITILAGILLHHIYLERRLRQLTFTSVSKVPSVEKVSELFYEEPALR